MVLICLYTGGLRADNISDFAVCLLSEVPAAAYRLIVVEMHFDSLSERASRLERWLPILQVLLQTRGKGHGVVDHFSHHVGRRLMAL